MNSPVLSLAKISRTYHQGENRLDVLQAIDLDIHAGELVALVGPSGSGKSTLLQIAGLLDKPQSGIIKINGKTIAFNEESARTAARSASLGFVYQAHHLLPEFTARENIALPLMIAGTIEREANHRADLLLERVGLSNRADHRPAELSGGEQQRVALARALVNRPSLLLADEPTGNLDPHTASIIFDLLLEITRSGQTAVFMATHNIDLARKMHRTITLQNGHILSV